MGYAQNLLLITQRAPKKATSIQNLSLSAYRAIALNNKRSLLGISLAGLHDGRHSNPLSSSYGFKIDSHILVYVPVRMLTASHCLEVRHVCWPK